MAGFLSVTRSRSSIINRKVLATFPEPTDDAKAAEGAGKCKGLPIMSAKVAWHGSIHLQESCKKKKSVYDESIELLLGMEIWALLSEIHHLKPEFSTWWISKLYTITISITCKCISIYYTRQYVQIKDVIPPNKCYIYPGYEGIACGSGYEINVGASRHGITFRDNKVIYVHNMIYKQFTF